MVLTRTIPAIIGVALLLTISVAAAPGQTADRSTAPTIKVTAREIILDITVSDNNGNPVHGLSRSDFTVKEDGKEEPLRSFEESASHPVTPLPKLPPNTYTNAQPEAPTGALNILVLDFLNTAAEPSADVQGGGDATGVALASQVAAKREAIKYVLGMPAGTMVIVLGLSDSLRVLQDCTSDPALLAAAIDSMKTSPLGHASALLRQFDSQRRDRTATTLTAMKQIAADVAAIKGKKNLLWLTVGMPWLNSFSLRGVYGVLAQAQIAVYPIDVRGVMTAPDAFYTTKGQIWQNVHELMAMPRVRR